MSRTALKKELSGYTKEQLIEVVLDLYASRKEVKEYFNFFLNPDSKKLFEKYQKVVNKELGKSKWSRSRARISVIKKAIKDFEGFQPDTRYRHELYQLVITLALYYEDMFYFSDTLYNGIYRIVNDYLAFADNIEELDMALQKVDNLIRYEMPGSGKFKSGIADACQAYIKSKSI